MFYTNASVYRQISCQVILDMLIIQWQLYCWLFLGIFCILSSDLVVSHDILVKPERFRYLHFSFLFSLKPWT